MATKTKAEIRNRILESIGVLAVGQSATASDAAVVDEVLDAAHERLQGQNLAPYELTAVPEWAQIPLRDYAAYDVAGHFGLTGDRLQLVMANREVALREMRRQYSGAKQFARVEVRSY